MEIKDVIKKRRQELGMTMLELAKAVGVTEATVSRWESGDIANLKLGRITVLAQVLQISPGELLGWDESDTADLKEIPPATAEGNPVLQEILEIINQLPPEKLALVPGLIQAAFLAHPESGKE